MSIETRVKSDRLYHLDLIRFIAALYVVFYHYCFRGFAKDNFSILQFEPLEGFSKYGYLGVDLFFIISGFVILLSIRNSNLIDFCISRFTRLYPAFWFCVITTALIIVLFGSPIFKVSLNQFLFNLTMLNGFFGIEHVDGVYWSLVVELKFYILVGIVLFFKKLKYIKFLGYILLAISILQLIIPFAVAPKFLQAIYYITFARWNPYFVAGMFFFLMKSEHNILKNLIPVIIAYFISLRYAILTIEHRNALYGYGFSHEIVIALITLFFIIIFLISTNKLQALNKRIFMSLGVLTYPLYLLHQNIGYIIFNHLGKSVNKWLLLSIVLFFMLIASYFISKKIEKPLGTYMRNKLKMNPFLLKLKTKF
ncbi:acyltransferase [Winogradskyella eckloniae]|uniref:acyltransferase family protein n=1 Tax=Winogradskyella eckloniae TaxID=1089306 RepID=UPI0015639AEF|nr:acyltransferase [Winogradskyella eckloniae]NRD20146.1 acyltransferase [Winogradskyella eckloniae]